MASPPDSTTTAHGFRVYRPRRAREGIALCLSGGGYRSALFHLGALRRLNELGILSQVKTITSVSGASIMLAQLASHLVARPDAWPGPGEPLATWDAGVARPLRAFTATDIRTKSVLTRLDPRNWLNRTASAEALAARYAAGPARGKLTDLPTRPRLVFCATDVQFRGQWVFDAGERRMGGEEPGYGAITDGWTVARAVAASSSVPGIFGPLPVRVDPAALADGAYGRPDRDALVRGIALTDGGIYDNLGLEPVWRDHATVLVSDAAPSFAVLPDIGPLWRVVRYPLTLLEQATDVRKRWLISSFIEGELAGAYWGIASLPTNYELPDATAYADALVRDFISQVRIDLDVFSEGEIAVLENHGYLMAEIAVKRHAKQLVRTDPPLRSPHEDWLDERKAERALAGSARTKLFARG